MSVHPFIAYGLHCVTREQIVAADQVPSVKPEKQRMPGFWPEEKSNRELRESLCNGCNYDLCASKCAYGREAKKRILEGRMANCLMWSVSYQNLGSEKKEAV